MTAHQQISLLLPITAAENIAAMRRIIATPTPEERAAQQRAQLARKVALADLIEARAK